MTIDQGLVNFGHSAAFKLVGQLHMSRGVFGYDNKAGGIFVQTVYNARASGLTGLKVRHMG